VRPHVPGFRATGLSCGIKPGGTPDLSLIVSDRPCTAAGLLTQSRFPGAPVVVTRRHLRRGPVRAILATSGNANVATGEAGIRDAETSAELVAEHLGVPASQILVGATGVIGRRLPMDAIRAGVPRAVEGLSPEGWKGAARAILTTDTRSKLAFEEHPRFRVLGIAKGSGMMMPNVATLLAFVVTDLALERGFARSVLREVADETVNCLTIDGQTSTSDMLVLLANGAAGNRPLGSARGTGARFVRALRSVLEQLTEALARDGEGVTRIAEIRVLGARSSGDAERAARAVANSVLVKTALFGADPNWGRIVQALGVADARVDPARLGVRIGGVELLRKGTPIGGDATLRRAAEAMQKPRVDIQISLGLGSKSARVLTTDLSYGYVRINAEYTT
jgi:glutamate N-acetyltransferase/amino-acid N-acetyltransferase